MLSITGRFQSEVAFNHKTLSIRRRFQSQDFQLQGLFTHNMLSITICFQSPGRQFRKRKREKKRERDSEKEREKKRAVIIVSSIMCSCITPMASRILSFKAAIVSGLSV